MKNLGWIIKVIFNINYSGTTRMLQRNKYTVYYSNLSPIDNEP